MPTKAKERNVSELVRLLGESQGVILFEYRGLTASKTQELRRKIRAASAEMHVAKNTLMRIALKEAGMVTADNIDTGPNAYVLSYGDITHTARTLRDFAKERGNEAVVIKGGILGQQILSKDDVVALADLPTRPELLAQVVGTMVAPIRNLLTVLNGPARALVTCLAQIQEKKENAA